MFYSRYPVRRGCLPVLYDLMPEEIVNTVEKEMEKMNVSIREHLSWEDFAKRISFEQPQVAAWLVDAERLFHRKMKTIHF